MPEVNVNIIAAFTAGLISFLAPCTFVTLPYFITYLTSEAFGLIENKDRKYRLKVFTSSLIYILGFLIVFTLLGMTATGLGNLFVQNRILLARIGGALMALFGFFILFGDRIAHLNFLNRTKKLESKNFLSNSYLAPLIIGMTSAFSWTPCIGPILGSILFLAGYSADSTFEGGLLLFFYGLGITLPFLVFSLFIGYSECWIKKMRRFSIYFYKFAGFILILLGVSIILGFSDVIFREVYKVFIKLGYKPQ